MTYARDSFPLRIYHAQVQYSKARNHFSCPKNEASEGPVCAAEGTICVGRAPCGVGPGPGVPSSARAASQPVSFSGKWGQGENLLYRVAGIFRCASACQGLSTSRAESGKELTCVQQLHTWYKCTHVHTHGHARAHAHTCTRAHMHTHTCTHICAHMHTHMCTRSTHMHTHSAHMHMHTCTHTVCTHTCTQAASV